MASSSSEIYDNLRSAFDEALEAGEFDADLDDFMADEVVPVWVGFTPEDTGDSRSAVGVVEPAHGGVGKVGSTSEIANLLEYGSQHNQAYAPRTRTIEHFRR